MALDTLSTTCGTSRIPSAKDRRRTPLLPEHMITADRLILAAGTLGTTFLLLNARRAFPGLSARLGTRFCGNGDLVSFASRSSKRDTNGERVPRVIDAGYGPVITS